MWMSWSFDPFGLVSPLYELQRIRSVNAQMAANKNYMRMIPMMQEKARQRILFLIRKMLNKIPDVTIDRWTDERISQFADRYKKYKTYLDKQDQDVVYEPVFKERQKQD